MTHFAKFAFYLQLFSICYQLFDHFSYLFFLIDMCRISNKYEYFAPNLHRPSHVQCCDKHHVFNQESDLPSYKPYSDEWYQQLW